MMGNVHERTEDRFRPDYESLSDTDPVALAESVCTGNTTRGGWYDDSPRYLRSASRPAYVTLNNAPVHGGFRLVRTMSAP